MTGERAVLPRVRGGPSPTSGCVVGSGSRGVGVGRGEHLEEFGQSGPLEGVGAAQQPVGGAFDPPHTRSTSSPPVWPPGAPSTRRRSTASVAGRPGATRRAGRPPGSRSARAARCGWRFRPCCGPRPWRASAVPPTVAADAFGVGHGQQRRRHRTVEPVEQLDQARHSRRRDEYRPRRSSTWFRHDHTLYVLRGERPPLRSEVWDERSNPVERRSQRVKTIFPAVSPSSIARKPSSPSPSAARARSPG